MLKTLSQLFLCFDALFATANNLNRELQAELQKQYDALKKISIGDCAENHEVNHYDEAYCGNELELFFFN